MTRTPVKSSGGRYNITAMAYSKKGRLLSIGFNSYEKTHPLQAKLGNKSGRPNAIYLHAEISCLIRAREQVHRLVVVRYDKDGKPALAKPCPSCQLAIRQFQVKQVEYTK